MTNLNALKIDPEFQGKIPPLNAEEEHILEQNMVQERRLLNPLIIWKGTYWMDIPGIASSSITRKSLLK